MAVNVVQLKGEMRKYAEAHELKLPPVNWTSDSWGEPAQTLAWRVSSHKTGHGTTSKVALWRMFHPSPVFVIHRDYHAVHHSGLRALSAIDLIVLHDMEVVAYTTAAEAVGRYFESKASGGSTHYGVDNDSIQQYLDDNVIPWGAPYANTNGIHIEQMGVASWTENQWKVKAAGTLKRTAWLIAHESKKLGIPIRPLTDDQVVDGTKGITTHRQCTRAFHVAGGHTDPGTGFPFAEILSSSRALRASL